MTKIALIVNLSTTPGRRDEVVAHARKQAETTLATDEDCLRYDVLVPEDTEDAVILYEVYANEAAVDRHLAAEHTQRYIEATRDLITARPRTACRVVEG